ncbi:hypothetical protein V5799_017138 [Amblyomma americanum]|uniref:Uncharacterized protein n=1 Tax=Amblyomma americanum TaxID=6943 RepID=A0AAQ4F3N6_AMBAM
MAWTSITVTDDVNPNTPPDSIHPDLTRSIARRTQLKTQKSAAPDATTGANLPNKNTDAPATRTKESKGKILIKWKPRPMCKPTPEDFVIIIKPRTHFSLHEAFMKKGYGTLFSAHLGPELAQASTIIPSKDQNIIVVYTSNVTAASRLIGEFALETSNGSVPFYGYLKQDSEDICHGVITVLNEDTSETLQHTVQWRTGTIKEIRKFGKSNKARITFEGKEKPRTCTTKASSHLCETIKRPSLPATSVESLGIDRTRVQTCDRTSAEPVEPQSL